jgi:hypothetical protein
LSGPFFPKKSKKKKKEKEKSKKRKKKEKYPKKPILLVFSTNKAYSHKN